MSQKIATILVPVDGSKGSLAALEVADQFAQAMGVGLQLLYSFPRNSMEMFGPIGEEPSKLQLKYLNSEAFGELRESMSRKVFDAALKRLKSDVKVEEVLLVGGHPAEAILDHAAKVDGPMIVVGSRGLSTFKGMFLGSVSQSLVHHAKCPVTVVR